MARRLAPEELRVACEPGSLPFRSTEELPPLHRVIGQDQAAGAIAFGIGIRRPGYNLVVLGLPATVEQALAENLDRLEQMRKD